ncbi:hypothetical protein ABFV83_12510 [Lacrimispora sp. BS-2]|uniref:Uncharacterized protein n=1 Tax=Lacrimispora sp. BS-2 TaxID=3151850 RepID=A0AAU7PJV1_9FIRM
MAYQGSLTFPKGAGVRLPCFIGRQVPVVTAAELSAGCDFSVKYTLDIYIYGAAYAYK